MHNRNVVNLGRGQGGLVWRVQIVVWFGGRLFGHASPSDSPPCLPLCFRTVVSTRGPGRRLCRRGEKVSPAIPVLGLFHAREVKTVALWTQAAAR